jgi:hypothetical protein
MAVVKPMIGSALTVTDLSDFSAPQRIINIVGQWIYVENGERFHFCDHRIGQAAWQTTTHTYEL